MFALFQETAALRSHLFRPGRGGMVRVLAACALLLGFSATEVVAAPAGRVKTLEGTASIIRAGKQLPVRQGTALYQNDQIKTASDSALGVLFNDDTLFSMGPNSDVTLDHFIYNPARDNLRFSARMVRGTMSYLSGRIGKFRPEAVSIETPMGTIGIRGTFFAASIDEHWKYLRDSDGQLVPNEQNKPVLLTFPRESGHSGSVIVLLPDLAGRVGALEVSGTEGESRVLDQAYQAVRLFDPSMGLEYPSFMSRDEVQRLFAAVLRAVPGLPGRYTLHFSSGSAKLNSQARSLVREALAIIHHKGRADIAIIGHTDRTGSEDANRKLSLARADAVRRLLIAEGIPEDAISVSWHGENEPVVPTRDGVSEPRNRRVELVVR